MASTAGRSHKSRYLTILEHSSFKMAVVNSSNDRNGLGRAFGEGTMKRAAPHYMKSEGAIL